MLYSYITQRPLRARMWLLNVLIIPCAIIVCAAQVFAAGTLDPSFGNNGEANLTTYAWNSLQALQPDGKIIVVSPEFFITSYYDFSIARYNSNGSLDMSYGRRGRVYADLTEVLDRPMAVAIQSDGKLLVAGYTRGSLPELRTNLMLVRYHLNGSLDESFGNGGIVITDRSQEEEIHAIAIQPDGKIVVAGVAGLGAPCGQRLLLGRYKTQGLIDRDFGVDGISYIPVGVCTPGYDITNLQFSSVSISPGGKIIAGGKFLTYYINYLIARFNSDGTLEMLNSIPTFHENSDGFTFVSEMPDGKILAIGEKVARFMSDGSLDPSFPLNDQLVSRTPFSRGTATLLPDGKTLWFTYYATASTPVDYVRVLSKNGGVVGEIRKSMPYPTISGVLAQPDGKIIVFSDVMRRYLRITSMAGRQTDFDGDYKTDIGYFRPVDGTWAIQTSIGYGSGVSTNFGMAGDYPTPGSFFSTLTSANNYGGSRALVSVYRPSTGVWHIDRMCGAEPCYRVLGGPGDVPVGGDYDGDGMDDFAVFKDGVWNVLTSYTNNQRTVQWGTVGDQPVPGDYDFDGFTDLAVYRPSNGTWYVSLSSSGNSLIQQFGDVTDRPVPGDYDGDGRTDFAVFRPAGGNWYILNSGDGSMTAQHFGLSTDRPVPGDYDGDGRTDIAVFRNGFWYLLRSSAGLSVVEWGDADTVPLTPGYSAN